MDFSDLARLASGHVESWIVQTAVRLGVFEILNGPASDATVIASSLGTEPRATELLLNALVALGLLEKQGGRFSLTSVSSTYLLSSSSRYFGDMILFEGSLWNCWERLEEALRSGAPVRPANMYQDEPEETERFIRAMDSLVKARGDAELLARRLDWSCVRHLLDIGSGPGTYPIHLCRLYPHLRATIFDLPATLKLTDRFVRQAGLQGRITLMTGDYRNDVIPGSYQAVLMSNIIHAESYEDNERLIAKLYPSLHDGGKIIIKDHILDPSHASPPAGAMFALLMLLTTRRGRCYAFGEVKNWLEGAGFKRIFQVDLPPPFTSSLVTGEK